MQLVGQNTANFVNTTCCLLSYTAMSLSWLPSGVTVMYTLSTGAQVAATVHAAFECGQLAAIKGSRAFNWGVGGSTGIWEKGSIDRTINQLL